MAEGFVAALPLNETGLRMLALGTFNATSPDLRLLTKPDERPVGLYMWGVYAPGPLAAFDMQSLLLWIFQLPNDELPDSELTSTPSERRYIDQ